MTALRSDRDITKSLLAERSHPDMTAPVHQLVRAEPMCEAEGTTTTWVGTSTDIDDYVRRVAGSRDMD